MNQTLLIEATLAIPHTLEYHDGLNQVVFDESGKMLPDVRDALMKVAKNFIETMSPFIEWSDVSDVCLTGSNANYNYTPGSDLDLHIMCHFENKMAEDYAQAKKTVWNNQYKVSIYGFPVEVYPQNKTDTFVTGSGWYSITDDKWLSQPEHLDHVDVGNPVITQIAEKFAKQIDFVVEYHVSDLAVLHRLGEKIWGLRDQKDSGEFSVRNLAFKELRNNGFIDKYRKYINEVETNQMSIK